MQVHIGFSVTGNRRAGAGGGQAGGGGTTAALFSTVNAAGWTATYPAPPTPDPVGAPERFSVTRAGFTTAGVATTYTDLLTVTRRLRQVWPNQAQLTADQVSLSDYVYAGDVVAGAANNSTETSPPPVANWVTPDRLVVGNTVTLEVVAFHRHARGGEQVACVEFSATDGTATVTQTVAATVVSGRAGDRNAVIVHRALLDISTLANPATITCNAKVYPWVGGPAAIRDSATGTAARGFSPRIFRRDTARAAAPPLAYVATTGNDTTGVVSTTAATAAAAPFLTILGAIKGLKAAAGVTGGRIDGCEVRLGAGSFVATSLAATDVTGGIQDNAHVTITRAPGVARASAIVTFGAAAFRARFPWLRFADVTIQRTGTQALTGESAAQMLVLLDDVTFDNASHNATLLSNAHLVVCGCDATNMGASPMAAGPFEVRLVRGLQCASGASLENWLVVGSRLTGGNHGSALLSGGPRSSDGAITAYNYTSGYRPTYGGLAETIACAIVQNVIEFFSATSNTGLSISPDSGTTNTAHALVFHNTVAGFFNHGRSNMFYDDTVATARTHRLLASKGNIHVSVNNKGDVFRADGTRIGNWPYLYGVGCAGELVQFDAADPAFRQDFAGLGAVIGTSTTTAVSPQFTTPAHTVNGVAGAGGGTYTVGPVSPARQLLADAVLRFDLAGAARAPTQATAGAYT
jgi:hypothetical protein